MPSRMSFVDCLKPYEAVNTDKGTDKNTTHSYGPVYDQLFQPHKESAKRILEIGVSGGFGLLAYADYFQHAEIFGLDISDNCASSVKAHPRVHLTFGNALDKSIVDSVEGPFDIIIEDASHFPDHQLQHFFDFAHKVKPGGLYIIEDINDQNADWLRQQLHPLGQSMGFTLEWLDLRPIKSRYDDILLVARRQL